MIDVYKMIARVASTGTTVLVQGERAAAEGTCRPRDPREQCSGKFPFVAV